jgi:hypothetical protein
MSVITALNSTETHGTVVRFLLNADGTVLALLLNDGTEVRFPPHLSSQVTAAIKPGGTVRVRGICPPGECVVAAASLETADGTRIVAQEPRAPLFRQR